MNEKFEKAQFKNIIRQEFEQTLSDRVTRYLQVKRRGIVPYTHFSAPSSECILLFRDGYFYASIALTQAVAEALVRFMCDKNSWAPSNSFEKNVSKLFKGKSISCELKESFLKIWEKRNDYHHLNPKIEVDRQALEKLAKEKIRLLTEVENEVFRFKVENGKVVPEHPKYWRGSDNQVFFRPNL